MPRKYPRQVEPAMLREPKDQAGEWHTHNNSSCQRSVSEGKESTHITQNTLVAEKIQQEDLERCDERYGETNLRYVRFSQVVYSYIQL